MKPYQTTAGLIAMLAITSAAAFGKTISDYAEANLVLGQADFTSNTPRPLNAASLNRPVSVIVDPVTRKVFVSEEGDDRVLRYASADALANGAAAEAVFGQALFTTNTTGATGNQFGGDPESIFLDAKGRLWVPDYYGDRVLMFKNASSRDSGAFADRVFGQPDFTTSTYSGISAVKMSRPYDVCVDAADRLWVADSGNNRVLRFDSISTKPSGAPANGVLGQANFITDDAGSGSNGLQQPTGVTISANGTLYVTCNNGNRVMRFNDAAGLENNAPASAVLGQPDFATISSDTTAEKMNSPYGAWITPDDSLWIADANNNRVLRFNNASTKPSGAPADGVIGQPNFTSNIAAATRRGLDYPYYRPFVDTTGSLWIADGDNNRVLRFSPDATPPLVIVTPDAPPPVTVVLTPDATSPLLAMTTVLKKFTTKAKVTLSGTASDKYGISKVEYRIGKGPFKLATITTGSGTTAWSFKAPLKKGRNVITIVATDVDGIASLSQVIKIKRK